MALLGLGDDPVDHVGELAEVTARLLLDPDLEPGRDPEAGNGRRIDWHDESALDPGGLAPRRRDDVVGRQAGTLALLVVLQRNEQHAEVGLVLRVDQAVPVDLRDVRHGRVPGDPLGRLRPDRVRAVEARGVGQEIRGEQVALVLLWHERGRQRAQQRHAAGDDQRERRERDDPVPKRPLDSADVAGGGGLERVVEPLEEAALLAVPGPHQDRGERRRQREGDDAREQHRDRDRYRELLVEGPGDAAEERHRDEDRVEHQHDRDHRPADFLHRLLCGGLGVEPQLHHVALGVLDDDDRVVDDQPDREDHPEEREHVDREAEHQHSGARRESTPARPASG